MPRPVPDFGFERAAIAAGARSVAGIDEAGRGPLAGPVLSAAVTLDPERIPEGLADSKSLRAADRERLAGELKLVARFSIATASVAEIDSMNILAASLLAMERAVAGLPEAPDRVLVDGNIVPKGLAERGQALVRGDARCLSIAAASILAKTARDAIMADLAREFPGYGWERNAGYPTQAHVSALRELGVTPHHRRSFRPVRDVLIAGNSGIAESMRDRRRTCHDGS